MEKEDKIEIVEPTSESDDIGCWIGDMVEGLARSIADSFPKLEKDMKKPSELARFMGVFDSLLTVTDRLGNGICMISEETIDELLDKIRPYLKTENPGVKLGAECLDSMLSDSLLCHGGIVMMSVDFRDAVIQALEDLVVTIEECETEDEEDPEEDSD